MAGSAAVASLSSSSSEETLDLNISVPVSLSLSLFDESQEPVPPKDAFDDGSEQKAFADKSDSDSNSPRPSK